MSLSPRAIATLGIGYGPRPTALLGLWPTAPGEPEQPQGAWTVNGLGPRRRPTRSRKRDDEAILLFDD
jgi:hypothetical protein